MPLNAPKKQYIIPPGVNSAQGGMTMRGKVKTYQKCPECGGKFITLLETASLTILACKAHNNVLPTRLYLDIYHEGQRYKIMRDEHQRLLTSCDYASTLLGEIRRKGFNPSRYVQRKLEPFYLSSITRDWLKEAERSVELGDMAYGTLEWKEATIKRHILPYFGETADIREIQTHHVEKLRKSLDMGPNGRNNIMWQLKSIFKFAQEQELRVDPLPKFTISKVPKKDVRVISREAAVKVLSFIRTEDRPIFEFGSLTGCRKSEARALQWEDINWKDGYITFCHNYTGSGLNERLVKRLKENQIKQFPLIESVRAILSGLDRQLSGPVFICHRTGRPYSKNMNPILRRAFVKAGIAGIPLENFFRHSAATSWLDDGVHIADVSKLLGHASIRTTEKHYIKAKVKRLGEVLEGKLFENSKVRIIKS
jgi:integrase